MKYTKGEWEVGVSDIIGTGNDREHIVVGLKENLHKIIATTGFVGANDESESIANANLISAAPEMYEALQGIRDGIVANQERLGNGRFDKLMNAIHKAEGK